MPRITEYTASTSTQGTPSIADNDVFIIDGNSGSRKITALSLAEAMGDKLANAGAAKPNGKSGMYRGANLGTGATFAAASTAAQRAAIADGSFTGLFIGDYWTINGRVYRIADFNYWLRTGDNDFNTNHIVLVPDSNFGNDKMNDTNVTTGAYAGSKMYTDSSSVLNTARSAISTVFGGYLATIKKYLPTTVSNGVETGGAWKDSTVDIMSEIEVYGCRIKSCNSKNHTTEKQQFALFRLNPAMVNPRYHYWLRDVVSDIDFAFVYRDGIAYYGTASANVAVRPVFAVKGTA